MTRFSKSTKKERAKVEEEIDKAEKALKALGYTDKDLKKLEQKSKMKVVKEEELKMKEFLVKLVKFFIILAILGPVISIIIVGIGIGALLF